MSRCTLVLSTILVVLVVFLFLRNLRATLVPAVCVPLSLFGTFGSMYMLGFSLDNFSLMALIISTGFVVDNTIVVLENVTRHLELGETRLEAALKGAQEVTFTVLSMSISLVAVFLPILLMGGIVGQFFHEFAVTLTIAIVISLIDLAHRDADDVRLSRFQRRGRPEPADARLAARLRAQPGFLPPHPGLVARQPSKTIMFILLVAVGAQCLSAGHHPQGLLSRRR